MYLYLNACYDYLYHYQNALQTPSQNAGLTKRLYSLHTTSPQRAHGALEDPTALPQRPHRALSNTLCKRRVAAFVLNMFKINAPLCVLGDYTVYSQLFHSVDGDCTARTSAICNIFERCEDAALV